MAGEDRDYADWLRAQPCCAPCWPQHPSGEIHHARHDVGMGLRAHDHRAVPICRKHHTDLHGLSGPFRGWNRDGIRSFLDDEIARLRLRYLAVHLDRGEAIPS
jgi:hypothetical protein